MWFCCNPMASVRDVRAVGTVLPLRPCYLFLAPVA